MLARIQKDGLPDARQMRAEIGEAEQEVVKMKIAEYASLFERFTRGDDLSDEETERMTSLAEELQKLAEKQ